MFKNMLRTGSGRGPDAQERVDFAASLINEYNQAYADFRRASEAELKAFKPKEASYRIREKNDGRYVIERLQIYPAYHWGHEMPLLPPLKAEVEAMKARSTKPVWGYVAITADDGSALSFNVYDDAEAYLRRMTRARPKIVEFDFPPLTKRTKPSRRKADKA